jgi:hypothetical protein
MNHLGVCAPKSGRLMDLPKGRGMVAKEKGNLLGIKGLNKGEKMKQLTLCHANLLKVGYFGNGVEGICDIHM